MSSHALFDLSDFAQRSFELYSVSEDGRALQQVSDPEAFAPLLSGTRARGLVIYAPPAHLVGQALYDGIAPEQAVAAWTGTVQAHLALLRRARRKLTVLQAPASAEDREALDRLLAETYGQLPGPQPEALQRTAPPEEACFQLAVLALGQDADALACLNDLQARTLGPFDTIPDSRDSLARLAGRLRADREAGRQAAARAAEDAAELQGQLNAQVADLETEVRKLSGTLRQARADLAEAQASHARDRDEGDQRSSILVQQIQALEEALTSEKGDAAKQHTRYHELKEDLGQAKAALRTARDQVDQLRQEKVEAAELAREELGALSGSLEQAEERRQQTEALLLRQIGDLEAALKTNEAAGAEQRVQGDGLRKDLAQTKTALKAARTQAEQARAEAGELSRTLRAAQEAETSERQMNALLHEQVSDLEGAMRGLFETAEEARSRSRKLEDESAEIRRILTETQTDFEHLDGDRRWRDQVSAMFRQKSVHLETVIRQIEQSRQQADQAAQAQIATLQTENQALRSHVDSLYSSTSWRVTAPMRSIRHILKK